MKANGYPWRHAFRHALRLIVWPHDKQSRHEWKAMIRETAPAWKQAYCDEGTPLDVEGLILALSRDDA
jgi:hypothetical protein